MKITQSQEKGFRQFSINIETLEEARALWHLTNIASLDNLVSYCRSEGISLERFENAGKDILWKMVDNELNRQGISAHREM